MTYHRGEVGKGEKEEAWRFKKKKKVYPRKRIMKDRHTGPFHFGVELQF